MTDKQQPDAFCWATELAMVRDPVTLTVKEAREVSDEMQRMHAELERLALYKSLADEYGLSIFPDIAEMTAELETLRARFVESDMTGKQSDALELASVAESADLAGYPTAKKANAYYLCLLEDCAQMIRRLHAENETLRAKLKVYEDLGGAADDVQLLRMGYAAARLEIESLRAAQPAGAQQPGAAYAELPDSLICAVDQWFADNIKDSGGCTTQDVRELAEIFYDVTHDGGRESVDDALAIVESFGPGIGGLNDTYARQVLLAEEVKRLREQAPNPERTGELLMGLAVIRELTGTQQKGLEETIEAVRAAVNAQKHPPAPATQQAGVALSDDLRDRLVAISEAIADQDDRAAQAMLREILKAPQPVEREPLTPREIELIDGMIAVQLDHAMRCDAIANRAMADKQKGWDMERVALLQKFKAAHGSQGGQHGADRL